MKRELLHFPTYEYDFEKITQHAAALGSHEAARYYVERVEGQWRWESVQVIMDFFRSIGKMDLWMMGGSPVVASHKQALPPRGPERVVLCDEIARLAQERFHMLGLDGGEVNTEWTEEIGTRRHFKQERINENFLAHFAQLRLF
ncbi:MAG: hypothetical protein NT005_03305 [Spirochaetes bacterium]|nr:hypothetical protein [Spirochaetota bacterium]